MPPAAPLVADRISMPTRRRSLSNDSVDSPPTSRASSSGAGSGEDVSRPKNVVIRRGSGSNSPTVDPLPCFACGGQRRAWSPTMLLQAELAHVAPLRSRQWSLVTARRSSAPRGVPPEGQPGTPRDSERCDPDTVAAVTHSVDVVVTTHEGWELTDRCLRHLEAQTVAHTVVVSDSASKDGTPDEIRSQFPHVVLLEHDVDPGYAAAINHGVAAGTGDVILLLNNDAFPRPDFLEFLLAAFDDDHVGAVAPLTVQPHERTIDSVGLTLDVTLAPFIRLQGRPVEEAATGRPLLVSPGGGADAYRRTAWLEAGGLDERLSFYGADIDLALRLRSLGWTTVAAPGAVAVHLRSATTGHRSHRARHSGGWARGFLLRRWSVLRSRAGARALVTECVVAVADMALSRDTVAARSRISGWKAAGDLPRRRVPSGAVDPEIGFLESLRLRWAVR
jgi:N-acetylglucosaminyl-diphospho-decaprenol L-rhamnosyltransferase